MIPDFSNSSGHCSKLRIKEMKREAIRKLPPFFWGLCKR
jgi:hypothetical protein